MPSDPEYYLVIISGLKLSCFVLLTPPQPTPTPKTCSYSTLILLSMHSIYKEAWGHQRSHIFLLFVSEQSHKIIMSGVFILIFGLKKTKAEGTWLP